MDSVLNSSIGKRDTQVIASPLFERTSITANPETYRHRSRHFITNPGDKEPELGLLKNLQGTWKANGAGWNMIALPLKDALAGSAPFRVLMNQYNETLTFSFVDDNVRSVPAGGRMTP